jgi:putative transposase
MFAADILSLRAHRMKDFRYWRWHLDKMLVKINVERLYLWWALDHEGEILKICVTGLRHKALALTLVKSA